VTGFLVGAAVGIVGTVVGWLLSVLTEARSRRKAAKVAARMIFFELGLNVGVAQRMAESDWDPNYRHVLSRSAWDRYAADLTRVAPSDVVTLLAQIYSTHFTRMFLFLSMAMERRLPDGGEDECREASEAITTAIRKVGQLAGENPSQVEAYLEPYRAVE